MKCNIYLKHKAKSDQDKLLDLLCEKPINVKNEIMKLKTLLEACAFCKYTKLQSNVFGPLLEYYIINKYKCEKVKASDMSGDIMKNSMKYELKISLGGKTHEKFNFVQIRPGHTCDYLLGAYHLSLSNYTKKGRLYVFLITKKRHERYNFKIRIVCSWNKKTIRRCLR